MRQSDVIDVCSLFEALFVTSSQIGKKTNQKYAPPPQKKKNPKEQK